MTEHGVVVLWHSSLHVSLAQFAECAWSTSGTTGVRRPSSSLRTGGHFRAPSSERRQLRPFPSGCLEAGPLGWMLSWQLISIAL